MQVRTLDKSLAKLNADSYAYFASVSAPQDLSGNSNSRSNQILFPIRRLCGLSCAKKIMETLFRAKTTTTLIVGIPHAQANLDPNVKTEKVTNIQEVAA